MGAINYANKAILRTAPPVEEYFLAIMPRDNVLACSLNKGAATWGETALTYDTVTFGAWGDVVQGQTLLCYSSTGAYKGKVRLRAIDAGTITVAANYDIEWADDDLLYVVNVFEPWSRPTRIIDNGPGLGLEYYKDTDIAWVSNAYAFRPKANAGIAYAGFLGAGGTVDVQFGGASWSYATAEGATIASYAWDIGDGAFVVGDAASESITARFSHAGFRWISLTVTDSNGMTGVNRLPVWTFGGNYQPLTEFSIQRRGSDGRDWELQIEAFGDDLEPGDIPEGTQVCLFVREYVNGTEVTGNMSCPFPGRQHIRMVGWILKDSVEWDPETGVVRFTVGTLGKVADDLRGFPTFIEDKPTGQATNWHHGEGLTVRNVIHFLWYWHSNLPILAYIEITPADVIAGRKFRKLPPFKQIESDLLLRCFAKLGVTRWGSVHCLYDPQILDATARAARATVMDLETQDWTTELAFGRAHRPQLSAVHGGGIAYDGAEGTPYRGRAPGQVGRESGKELRSDNLIISSQSDLNDKLGRLLASRSAQQEDVTIENFYDVWEPALQEYFSITVAAADNPRGQAFDTDDLWIIRRVEIEDETGSAPTVRVTGEPIIPEGTAIGIDVPIPQPPTYPPPEPPVELPPLEPPEEEGTGEVVLVGGEGGIAYTLDCISGNPPTWTALNGGLSDASYIYALCNSPLEPHKAACIDNSRGAFVNADWTVGNDWTSSLTAAAAQTAIDAALGVSSDEVILVDVKGFSSGTTAYLLCVARYRIGLAQYSVVLRSDDWGASWACGGVVYGNDTNNETDTFRYREKTADDDYGVGELAFDGSYLYICGQSPYHSDGRSCLNRSSDWGATWENPVTIEDGANAIGDPGPACAKCDSTGMLYMVPWQDVDDGGDNAFSSRRRVRNVNCGGAAVNAFDFEYIQIPATGDYTIDYKASVNNLNCRLNVGLCDGTETLQVSLAIETADDTAFLVNKAQIHAVGNTDNEITGSTVENIAANKYLRILVNVNAGLCEADGYGYASATGPAGAQVLFDGDSIVASASIPTSAADINEVKDITEEDGYGVNRGMLELLADDAWATLQIESPGTTTSQTTLEVNGVLRYTFLHPYRQLHGFALDEYTLYLGRSWLADEEADASDPQLFGLSLTKGDSWADKSGNLYALGMRSITGIAADWSSDS